MMKRAALMTIALALMAGTAWARLPAPPPMNDEQKLKAEAAKTKAAEDAKKEAGLLAKYQDKAADNYKKGQGKANVKGGSAAASPKARK
jgi:hypothetical protein